MRVRTLVAVAASLVATMTVARADSGAAGSNAERPAATLYKNPQCGCCEEYAHYLRRHGFVVKEVATHDLSLLKKRYGVSDKLEGCHTMLIDRYIVEGHVPVSMLDKLLTQRPNIRGISLPGMPSGSPGMTGEKSEAFTAYVIDDGAGDPVYATE